MRRDRYAPMFTAETELSLLRQLIDEAKVDGAVAAAAEGQRESPSPEVALPSALRAAIESEFAKVHGATPKSDEEAALFVKGLLRKRSAAKQGFVEPVPLPAAVMDAAKRCFGASRSVAARAAAPHKDGDNRGTQQGLEKEDLGVKPSGSEPRESQADGGGFDVLEGKGGPESADEIAWQNELDALECLCSALAGYQHDLKQEAFPSELVEAALKLNVETQGTVGGATIEREQLRSNAEEMTAHAASALRLALGQELGSEAGIRFEAEAVVVPESVRSALSPFFVMRRGRNPASIAEEVAFLRGMLAQHDAR
eukprot:5583912-Pleurochrysis_carterae.AAC.1